LPIGIIANMYKVMPVDPGPDGTYAGVDAVPADADEQAPFEVVFRVPRLEGHEEEDRRHYTIVLPRYAAEEMRQQAHDDNDHEVMTRTLRAPRTTRCAQRANMLQAPLSHHARVYRALRSIAAQVPTPLASVL
jgi:hypothetical protein